LASGAEVARRAERALLEHYGENVVVEKVDEALYGLELHARVAVAERLNLEQEHKLDNAVGHTFAGAARVRHHEVFLELREVFPADGDVAERAEAGGNAVDRFLLCLHLVVEEVAASGYAADGVVGEVDADIFVENVADSLNREAIGRNMMDFHKNNC